MNDIIRLFWETRKERIWFHQNKFYIEASAGAIREKALLDAMVILGLDKETARRMRKL